MDLIKSGQLLRDLRKAKGFTQKQVADRLGVLPKTVSKWETGKGFPDVSVVSALAEILGVSEKIILSGSLVKNKAENGNVKRTKFYICPYCGSFMQGVGGCTIICCGKTVEGLKSNQPDDKHKPKVSHIENDFYIEFDHEMTKEHYIKFVSYVGFDRVLTVRLYPEQNPSVRFPVMRGGKLYYYCSEHGLFEYKC